MICWSACSIVNSPDTPGDWIDRQRFEREHGLHAGDPLKRSSTSPSGPAGIANCFRASCDTAL